MEINEIRAKAEDYDVELTKLLAERAKFPFDSEFYSNRDSHPVFRGDSCLFAYIKRFYSEILRKLCQEGKIQEGLEHIVQLDRELALKLMRRTTEIGAQIGEYKHPRGLPVYVPEVEERKLQEREEQAKQLGTNSEKIKEVFRLIFEETKRIEDICKGNRTNVAGGIRSVVTDCPDMIEAIRAELIREGERLGGKHSVGVSEVERAIGGKYIIILY